MSEILFPSGLALLFFSLILFTLLLNERRYQRKRLIEQRRNILGLPPGELVYENVDGEGELLSSDQYPLVGKPDYILQLPDGRPVPIELKLNMQNVTAPSSNHMIQIAAYCLILEDYFELPPTYGILRYADHEFNVEYTPALRKKVMRLLAEMARCDAQHRPPLARQRVAKCRACAFQPTCPVGQNTKKGKG